MRMLCVTVDGRIAGYVRDNSRGRDVADRYVLEHMKETGSVEPVRRIPQGAQRLDKEAT